MKKIKVFILAILVSLFLSFPVSATKECPVPGLLEQTLNEAYHCPLVRMLLDVNEYLRSVPYPNSLEDEKELTKGVAKILENHKYTFPFAYINVRTAIQTTTGHKFLFLFVVTNTEVHRIGRFTLNLDLYKLHFGDSRI